MSLMYVLSYAMIPLVAVQSWRGKGSKSDPKDKREWMVYNIGVEDNNSHHSIGARGANEEDDMELQLFNNSRKSTREREALLKPPMKVIVHM